MKSLFSLSTLLFIFLVAEIPLKSQTVTDVDGNLYPTIAIGTQVWMKENLNVTRFRNGDIIPTTADTLQICGENSPKYQWTAGSDSVSVSGRLYTWYTVMDSRNVCPSGWHLPDNTEWQGLRKWIGVPNGFKVLTANDSVLLNNRINEFLNKSEHMTLIAMKRDCDGSYQKTTFNWWSSTVLGNSTRLQGVGMFRGIPFKLNHEESCGFPVRCIKDPEKEIQP